MPKSFADAFFLRMKAQMCIRDRAQEREYVIVVHGGAGAMENLEDDKEKSTLYLSLIHI